MILSDRNIRQFIADGALSITPLSEHAIRPASVDLCLGPELKIEDRNVPGGWRVHDLREGGEYRLYHGDFVLAATLERVTLSDCVAGVLAGKSSRAREGIQVEAAGYVDPGWDGELTMEITRFRRGESKLTLGMPICQIRFELLLSPCERPYGSDGSSHYQHSVGPVVSRGVLR
jgi:dCTP deaminase